MGLARILVGLAVVMVASCHDRPRSSGPLPVDDPGRALSAVQLVAAPPSGEVSAIVREKLAAARSEGRDLLVYVGATWCEPCMRFHDAAKSGQLDAKFPSLRLLEFDLDRDHDRLDRAGYASHMIPLFVVPAADGTPTPARIEGSIKGPGSVQRISDGLAPLLSASRAARSPGP